MLLLGRLLMIIDILKLSISSELFSQVPNMLGMVRKINMHAMMFEL